MKEHSLLINLIRLTTNSIKPEALRQSEFIEHILLPMLGLNDENINEQPKELIKHLGGGLGLKIWQYPNQFSKYASLIAENAHRINSYIEIGCRHGGTFIFHTEMLRLVNAAGFKKSVAVDIIEENELLQEYNSTSNSLSSFMRCNSGTQEFKDFISKNKFDLVFIDGDHSYLGVKNDAEISFNSSNIQVFHDISSDPCPGVKQFWEEHKSMHSKTHDFYEFTEQYDSVDGNFLGIGVSIRKEWI